MAALPTGHYSSRAVNANTDVSAAVLIGSTVTFSCSVNDSTKIVWESTDAISVKNELVTKFAERYSVKHMNGKTDLIIKNIQHCDAGSYRCRFFKNDEERKCEFLLITMGSPVVCDMNSPKVNECSCHVRHSNDTVPHFNCSRKLSYMVLNTMSIRQTGDICPLKDKTYNITTLTLNGKDLDKPLGCDVSYCLPNDSSHVYLTEHFVIPRRVQVSDVQDTTLSSPTTADEARPTPVNVILLSVVCVAVLLTVVFGAITVLHLAKKAKPSRRAVENETAQPDLNEELDTINHAGNFGRRTPYVPAAADDTGSSTESTDLTKRQV